jgi:hypothetical protein
MGIGAAIGGIASLGSAVIGGNAAQNAAQTQANAGQAAQNQLLQIGQNVSGMYTPYQQTGQLGLNSLNQLANTGYLTNQFNNQDLNAQLAPNYAFQLQQGQAGQNAAANATGGLVGGNAQQALAQYNQNFAANAYQNAFNNYQTQRTNVLNNASTLAGIGQNAVQGSANAQLGIGTNISNITQGIANAQAASQISQGNLYGGALQNAGNLYTLSNLVGNQNNNPSQSGLFQGYGIANLNSGYQAPNIEE